MRTIAWFCVATGNLTYGTYNSNGSAARMSSSQPNASVGGGSFDNQSSRRPMGPQRRAATTAPAMPIAPSGRCGGDEQCQRARESEPEEPDCIPDEIIQRARDHGDGCLADGCELIQAIRQVEIEKRLASDAVIEVLLNEHAEHDPHRAERDAKPRATVLAPVLPHAQKPQGADDLGRTRRTYLSRAPWHRRQGSTRPSRVSIRCGGGQRGDHEPRNHSSGTLLLSRVFRESQSANSASLDAVPLADSA